MMGWYRRWSGCGPATPAARTVRAALFLAALLLLLATPQGAWAQESPDAPADPAQGGQTVYFPIAARTPLPVPLWPAVGTTDVSPNAWLAWGFDPTGLPPALAEGIRYDVLLGQGDATPWQVVATNLEQPVAALFGLALGTDHTWQVRVRSAGGLSVLGPIWRFTTLDGAPPATDEAAATMLTIPEGEFQMGCDPQNTGGYGCREREVPLHTVRLDGYRIDQYETTNRQYRACVQAGACNPPLSSQSLDRGSYYDNSAYDFYPVLYVSWWDAKEYCEWADKRLPTEAEWEKAARGPIDTRPWPWGWADITCSLANYTETRRLPWRPCVGDTDVVGSQPMGASPYGAMDMAGNAFEWVWDLYDPSYYQWTGLENPAGPDGDRDPDSEPSFVLRGGSYRPDWFYPRAFNRHWGHHGDRASANDSPYFRNNQGGFRCAADLETAASSE